MDILLSLRNASASSSYRRLRSLGTPCLTSSYTRSSALGDLPGGLAQEAFREEWVFAPADDEGRRGDLGQSSGRVVAEVGLQRREEVRRVGRRPEYEPSEGLHERPGEALVRFAGHIDGGHVRPELPPMPHLRQLSPMFARLPSFLRQTGRADDEDQVTD